MTDARIEELSRLRAEAGLPSMMSWQQTVNWIAFRRLSDDDLTGRPEFAAKWVAAYAKGDIRQAEPPRNGTDYSLLRALRALAQGVSWRPPSSASTPEWQALVRQHPQLDFTPSTFLEVEHAAEDLVRRLGRTAASLATEMQADLDTYVSQKAIVDDAENAIREKQDDRRLSSEGQWPALNYRGVDIIEIWPLVDVVTREQNVVQPASQDTTPSVMRPRNPSSKTHTAEDEDACAAWLLQEWPKRSYFSKPEWRAEMRDLWPLLSDEAFKRAWLIAARDNPGMSAPGRKPRRSE
ncbi:MAG: hypothetical protein ACRYHQ_24800 [Janthinobacterium lividum]